MNPEPADFYTRGFFDSQKAGSLSSARVILGELFKLLGGAPPRAVDVGCGVGTWLRVARELGSTTVRGFDGHWVPKDCLEVPPECFTVCDLAHAASAGVLPNSDASLRYDLALSLEVAEHLPATSSSDFVGLLCKQSDLILFSAAMPHQGGVNHLNEDWPGSWSALFREHGFECFDLLRHVVWASPKVEWWYAQNILLFATGKANAQLRVRSAPVREPLAMIHPRKYLLQVALEQELRQGLVAATSAPFPAIAPFTPEVGHLERRVARLRARLSGDRSANSSTAAEILEVTSLYDKVRNQAILLKDEVNRLQSELERLQLESVRLRSDLDRQESESDQLMKQLTAARAEHARRISEIRSQFERTTRDLAEARGVLASLLASKSWKVTSPLRTLSQAARRVLQHI